MSKTLSVLIVENFVINEGPKWDKFKSGASQVANKVAIAALIGSSLFTLGKSHDHAVSAKKNYDETTWNQQIIDRHKETIDSYRDTSNDSDIPHYEREIKDRKGEKTKYILSMIQDAGEAAGSAVTAGAMIAGAKSLSDKDKKKKQEKKSLAESLNMVKLGMFLNEGQVEGDKNE